MENLPFHVWLALAKATPLPRHDDEAQDYFPPCTDVPGVDPDTAAHPNPPMRS
jgi:hypothetical protein